MKNKLIALMGMALLFLSIVAVPGRADSERNAIEAYTRSNFHGLKSTFAFILDKDGDMLPGVANTQDIGSSTEAWHVIYVDRLDASSGIVNMVDTFIDQPAVSTASYFGGSAGFPVSTTTLFAGGVTVSTDNFSGYAGTATNNVQCYMSFISGLTTHTITVGATFYGYDGRGVRQTEYMQLSTTTQVGQLAWSLISSVSLMGISHSIESGAAQSSTTYFNMGCGSATALSNDPNVVTDIYKITESTAAFSPTTQKFNLTTHTYWLTIPPDNARDYKVWYTVKRSKK